MDRCVRRLGGHITACTALTKGLEGEREDRLISSKPNALVLFNPVLRFDGIPQLMGSIDNDEVLGRKLSPTLRLTKDTPPPPIVVGTADRLKPQGDGFIRRAEEVGLRAEMFRANDQPHGFFNRPQWLQRAINRMGDFLTSLRYLKPGNTATAGKP